MIALHCITWHCMVSKCILFLLHGIALHSITLYCIIAVYCITLYCIITWYHICIAWLPATTTTDVSTKSCRPVGPTMLINVFYISLHFGTHAVQQGTDNTDPDVFCTFLHFSKNRKLINGWIGGGAAALRISVEKRQNWRLPSDTSLLHYCISHKSFTAEPLHLLCAREPPRAMYSFCKMW